MKFDPAQVPFSRYGSYISFSYQMELEEKHAGSFLDFARPLKSKTQTPGVYMQTVHGDAPRQEVFRLELIHNGQPISYQAVATPAILRLEAEQGFVEICIAESKLVRLKSVDVGLRLVGEPNVFDQIIPRGEMHWEFNSMSNRIRYMLTSLAGQLTIDAPYLPLEKQCPHLIVDFLPDPYTNIAEGVIEEFSTSWHKRDYRETFTECCQTVEDEYTDWLEKTPELPPSYYEVCKLAAYINWSCVVAPKGFLMRPGMYMSKGMMANIWSWDHCFNAMALAYKHPQLAWDQFMILFDHQDENGSLPDSVSDTNINWNYSKPPIHGWMLKRMMDQIGFITNTHLQEIYEPLCRWTDWWFNFRDDDRDGVPQYNHGNDSGWDNGTIFDNYRPVESPDLSAFLVIQMEVLAEIAARLGKDDESESWSVRAEDLLEKLLNYFWREDHFVALSSENHEVIETDSLQLLLPLILGMRLPETTRRKLIFELKQDAKFLTNHGLSTESISSSLYQADGYWRGPIWAPSTMIIVEGLQSVGEQDLAREISLRFCQMVARSGMAENFDALTGEGLRDRAYTWTSSVFFILAHEHLFLKQE